MACRLIESTTLEVRIAAAEDWLGRRSAAEQLLIVAPSAGSASELLRRVAMIRGAVFGWHRATLGRLASALAGHLLAERRLAVAGGLARQAISARVIHAQASSLGRYAAVGDRPGFAAALAHTLNELRFAGIEPARVEAVDPDLARLQRGYERELAAVELADRALVFRLALEAVDTTTPPVGLPLLLLDLTVDSVAERELLARLAGKAPDVLATIPAGDRWSTLQLESALGVGVESFDQPDRSGADRPTALVRLQRHLFQEETPQGTELEDDSVSVFSAPGESRECVEVARRVALEAERGVPFDRMAILLHSIGDHRRHLEEALARADIPAYFARGAVAPDPSGRAFVALLSCAAEDLSARRFAEYLSLGEVPKAEADGSPPPALPDSERWVPPDEEMIPEFLIEIALGAELAARERQAEEEDLLPLRADPDADPVRAGTLRAPRRWEQLLNDAAVIGGHERWRRRLEGKARELEHSLEGLDEPGEPAGEVIRRRMAELSGLRDFALPLLELLDGLREEVTWGEWIRRLSDLASRALRRPQRVLSVLAELQPMAPVGPVGLAEVRLVLARRLTEVVVPPKERRYGAVFVAPPEAVRGLPAFDVVFVPGLAEKLFPRRILEDPVLSDEQRRALNCCSPRPPHPDHNSGTAGASRRDARNRNSVLPTNEQRVERERLALRLAVGAARRRVYLSYSRLDLHHARPRVPSFYCLEVLRAVQGRLPGFGELARMAEVTGAARLAWPAPERPRLAIDEAEHDLALLERLRESPAEEAAATVSFLLTTNSHLGRAVRFRAERWGKKWSAADGLVRPSPAARDALQAHQLSARSYSATALQNYAVCPYRFLLYAVLRLAPREVPEPIDEIAPLQRGSLVHEVQFMVLRALGEAGGLPVSPANLERAWEVLDGVISEVTARYRDDFAPAIERVWEDGVTAVRADLREWLRREAEADGGWTPWRFEYSFGLPTGHAGFERELQDPHSTNEPASLACGIRLRGKIDLVERDAAGHLRVTDHKTGKVWFKRDAVVQGGTVLQPLLYALAARQLFSTPEEDTPQPARQRLADVESGRLYYCTLAGGFTERSVPLTEETAAAADAVAEAVRLALERGFLPAAPAEGGCRFCDYVVVCGRREERRVKLKGKRALKELLELRELP